MASFTPNAPFFRMSTSGVSPLASSVVDDTHTRTSPGRPLAGIDDAGRRLGLRDRYLYFAHRGRKIPR